jgi:hypothetical protein
VHAGKQPYSRNCSEDSTPMAEHSFSPPLAGIDLLAFRLPRVYTICVQSNASKSVFF